MIKQGRLRGVDVDSDAWQVDAYTQHRGKNDRLRFSSVEFAGELIVRDAAELGNALTLGIGHGKAFGCGLLRVRAVR